MKLYVYRSATTLTPFGDDVSEAQMMLETLASTQQRACRNYGLELIRIERPVQATERPCLLAADYLYFSDKALGDFLRQVKQHPQQGAALALKRCASVEHTLPLQDLVLENWEGDKDRARAVYDLWYVREGDLPQNAAGLRQDLAQRCPPLTVPMRELVIPIRLPALGAERQYAPYPITSTVCCHISHWAHLLWLTQLAFGIAWFEYYRAHKLRFIAKGLWAALHNLSLNKWKLMSGMNVMGKGCDVHPTAYLEGCILGDHVQIGAGSVLRNTLLGDNVILGDCVRLINSVISHDCYLTDNYFLVSSLAYPGSILSNMRTQMAVIGREAYMHGWCGMLDAKFMGGIKVKHRGQMVDTGRSFMASCVGHRAIMAAKVLVHPGREIPNDLLLVSHPDDVVAVVPDDIQPFVPMVRDRGTLVPLASLKNKP